MNSSINGYELMTWKTIDWELDLLGKLVALDTTNTGTTRKNYSECASLIKAEADKLGLKTQIIDGKSATEDGESRPNVIVDLDTGSDVTVLFVCHYDVVPVEREKWETDPFHLTIKGEKAFGRGAADDKSGIVIGLGAMRKLLDKDVEINLRLCAACDEETGGPGGINYLFNQAKIRGNAAIVVDAGNQYIGIGASGSIWGKVVVKGEGGHSGNPDILDNPIYRASRLIQALENHHETLKEQTTSSLRGPPAAVKPQLYGRLSVSMVKAWRKENIIPDSCEFRFDRRLTPEEDPDEAAKNVKTFIEDTAKQQGTKIKMEIINKVSGYYTKPEHPWVQLFQKVTENTLGREFYLGADLGFDDGMYLAEVDIPVVTFGALRDGTRYHGHNEFVWLEDLRDCRDVFVALGQLSKDQFKF
jgi:acetylornithine deacetylase/succinyl-diaminopimelate desuccinylase family protein